MNAYCYFARRFLDTPERPFLEDEGGTVYSYADLDRQTARVAEFLSRLGLAPGARVAAQIDKSPEGLFLYLGVLRAGFCFLPLNTAYREGELTYFVRQAEPEVVVCRPESAAFFEGPACSGTVRHVLTLGARGEGTLVAALLAAPRAFDEAPVGSDQPAVIIYTSGTTGRSKGALVTHGNLTSNADALHEAWGFSGTDVLIHALPMFHVHGLFVALHPILCAGARLLFQRKFDARAIIAAFSRATSLMGVPTFYTRLLDELSLSPETCRNMRLFISGSAPLQEATFRAFVERTGHRILERYGMSEAGMITSNPHAGERRPGTVGKPLPGVSLRVVDANGRALPSGEPGSIEIKGPNVFAGYFRMPDETRQSFTPDGFFKTGDIGRLSEDGYLSIVGRSKDIVITGGFNVYPKEVELVLDAFPEVDESAVIGVPDSDFGEVVTAVVVRKPGAVLTESGLVERLKTQMAAYKVPKRVHFVEGLPRNAMGKVEKKLLRQRFGA